MTSDDRHSSSGASAQPADNAAAALFKHAQSRPAATAVRTQDGVWSYEDIAEAIADLRLTLDSHQIVPGDRVLIACPTGPAFVVGYLAVLAHGAVAVTVNPQCTQRELSYFVNDCEATACLAGGVALGAASAAAAAAGIPLTQLIDPPEHDLPDIWSRRRRGTTGDAKYGSSMALPADGTKNQGGAVDGIDMLTPGSCAPVTRATPAVLLYTSGTTGNPKGAVLTHGNLLAAAGIFVDLLDIDDQDRLGTALPLFHVFGQVAVLLTALRAGAPVSLMTRFTGPGLLAMTARHELTILSGVPTMWTEMLHAADDTTRAALRSLRLACSGGAALPRAVQQAFRDRFGATVLDGYGLSESTSAASFNYPGREVKEGSVGQALPGVKLIITDDNGRDLPPGHPGEILLAGPTIMNGYWSRPAETAEALPDGWLRTGDIGQLDEDGYLWILDRKKDLIIRGGYNVYPREVEELLLHHPGVREVAVIGVPDDRMGEEIAAVIVPEPHTDAIEASELRRWLADRLAQYKHPRLYQVVDSLPKGSTGKLVKRQIDRAEVLKSASRANLRD